jgi:hypothetical protein
MIDFTITTGLNCSAAEAFAYITDASLLPTWQTNTISSVLESNGRLDLGARLRELHRAPGGKTMVTVVEVSEFEADRVFGLRVIEGIPIHLRIVLEPAEGGTVMRFRAYGALTGLLRVIESLVGRMLRRQFEQQCATLQRVTGREQDRRLAVTRRAFQLANA